MDLGTAIPRHCDTAIKIIPLKNHDRAVITVAGTDKSYALNGAKLPDLCKTDQREQIAVWLEHDQLKVLQ